MKNVLSIIIPVYNKELYLKRCIDSIINQTYKELDIVIINDGSTDNSLEILKEYENKDNRIKLINKQNGGVASARNAGIKSATGNYITFIDADDKIDSNMMKSMFEILKSTNVQVVKCWYVEEYANEQKYVSMELKENQVEISSRDGFIETIYPMLINTYRLNSCCGVLIDVNVIKENNISFDESIATGEDFLFICNIITHIERITLINNPYYHYFMTENSITRTRNMEQLKSKCIQKTRNYSMLYDFIKRWGIDTGENKRKISNRILKEFIYVSRELFNFTNQGVSGKEIENAIKDLWTNDLLVKSREINNGRPVQLNEKISIFPAYVNKIYCSAISKDRIDKYIYTGIAVSKFKDALRKLKRN